jgi:cobalamin biosynthesis Mg chelatase CobN
MADEKRVFDVAKPGSSKPETGSKPMVVGHKMIKDPTLKETEDAPTEETPVVQQTVSKTIKPLEKDMQSETEAEKNDKKVEEKLSDAIKDNEEKLNPEAEVAAETNETKSNEQQQSDNTEQDAEEKEKIADQKEISEQENALKQEENLQKIIKEKTYNVHVEEASAHALKTFLKTFVIVAIVGLLVLVVLIDAEVIDLGVTLPFDFL